MAINPDNITTIRVDQLNSIGLTLESLFPHTNGTELTSSSIGDLATLVATTIESLNGIGFLPISVTDGQQLPDLPENPVFFLVGVGTYLNVNGFSDIVCTENLNAIMSVTDHWEIAVEIPVNPLTGSVQSVTGSAVDNTDPLNPVINLSSAVTSVNGLTGAVVLDGDNIDVTDPTTSTDGTLNDALANIYASGGTPNLNEVTAEGGYTAQSIEIDVSEGAILNFSSGEGNVIGSIYNLGGEFIFYDVINGAQANLKLDSLTAPRAYYLPDKDGTFAMLDDVTGGGYTVVSSNQTAVNDTNYTVVANATFTDPSPTEGKGYVVYVRNGTATIGGTGYAVGSLVFRVFHSGAWSTREYKSNLTLDSTPTDGSTNGVESNGVFDALAGKVSYWGSAVDGISVANTLTITPTYSQLIPANTFGAGDVILIKNRVFAPGAKTSASNVFLLINTLDQVAGATQLGQTSAGVGGRGIYWKRTISIKGGTSKILFNTATNAVDEALGTALSTVSIDWTVDQYIIFAIGHTASDQTLTGDFYSIEKK